MNDRHLPYRNPSAPINELPGNMAPMKEYAWNESAEFESCFVLIVTRA